MTLEQEQALDVARPWIPNLPEEATVPQAAVQYAEAGWFVVPVDPATKNPGSRLGKGWQLQSNRDPSVIAAWWQRWPDAALALHVGRSGAVVLDVDDPSKLPDVLKQTLYDGAPPYQSTRHAEPGRGHYVFGAVPGQYGNSLAGFREAGLDGWGEVRGLNAVIVVAPSPHTKPSGRYAWQTHGPLPDVPAALHALLKPPGASGHQADPEDVTSFLRELPGSEPCPVVSQVLDAAVSSLETMQPGGRHDYMLSASLQLVRLGGQGHQGVAGALEMLHIAFVGSKPEAEPHEYGQAVVGAVREVLADPTPAANRGCCPSWLQDRWMKAQGFTPPPPTLPAADGVVIPGPWLEPQAQVRNGAGKFTDAALAETLAAETLLGRYRWAAGLKWLRWDGARWKRVAEADVVEQTRLWALGHVEAAAYLARTSLDGQVDDSEIKNWTAVAKASGRLNSITKLAQGVPGVLTDAAAFDADPDILNVRNGVLDLRTLQLWAPDPRRLVTKLAPIDYVPGVRHPDWDAALQALPTDERQWLQLRLGQAVTGHMTPDDVLVVCQGGGENGKSTLFDAVTGALGDYHTALADRVLTASPDAHPTELMDLRGARLATIEETPEARQLNVVRLKKTVGSSTITARYIAQDSVTYRATHSLFVSTNYRPIVAETDHGTWRRLQLLRFPYTFRKPGEPIQTPAHRPGDPGLKYRVQTDPAVHVAVLAWLADGAWAWYAGHRRMPAPAFSVAAETERWRLESDLVYEFWAEFLEPDPDSSVLARDMLAAFNRWLIESKQQNAWGDRTFNSRFGDHERTQRHGVRHQRVTRYAGVPVICKPPKAVISYANDLPRDPVLWIGVRFISDSTTPDPRGNPAAAHTAHTPPLDSLENSPRSTDQEPVRSVRTESADEIQPAVGMPTTATRSEQAEEPQSGVKPLPGLGDTPTGKPPTKAQQARAEERIRLLEEAAGPAIPFPALVSRHPGGATSVVPLDLADADALLSTITATDAPLTVDIENTGYPVGHQHYALRTVQLGNDAFCVNFDPAGDPGQDACVRKHLEQATWLHAHSSTADGVPLTVAGLVDWNSFWDRMHDTVIPAKLGDPQLTGSDPGLKEISASVLGSEAVSTAALEGRKRLFAAGKWLMDTEATTPLERSGWAQVDSRCVTMQRYAGADVLDTAAIAKRLPPIPGNILARERLAQRMTARIALDGLPLDADHVDAKHAEHTQARGELAGQLRDRYGIDKPGSAAQIVAKLTELNVGLPRTKPSKKFPDGQSSVAAGVLEAIKNQPGLSTDAFELIGTVLDYRHHATALSLFLETFHNLVHRGDGRIRSTIYTLGTDTGRMSSVRFNLQQLSRVGGIRACITADPGHKLISADFSGVEFRVAAALSRDPNLIRMLLEGVDMHTVAAQQVYGPQATKGDRYNVKRGNFGWLYGGRAPTLAKQMGCTVPVAQQLIDTLNQLLPGVTAWSEQVKAGLELGQTTYTAYSGRVIHLPTRAPHAAPNYEIQGTARELLVDGQIRWAGTPWGDSIMFPVHDEVVAMVPEDQADEATAALSACMATELNGVPIVADPSTPAFAWQDAA